MAARRRPLPLRRRLHQPWPHPPEVVVHPHRRPPSPAPPPPPPRLSAAAVAARLLHLPRRPGGRHDRHGLFVAVGRRHPRLLLPRHQLHLRAPHTEGAAELGDGAVGRHHHAGQRSGGAEQQPRQPGLHAGRADGAVQARPVRRLHGGADAVPGAVRLDDGQGTAEGPGQGSWGGGVEAVVVEGEVETGDAAGSDSESPAVVSLSLPSSPRKPLLSPSASFESTESEDSGDSRSPTTTPLTPPLSSFTPTLTAAILSSISVLLGKCTMQLIKTSVTTPANQFTSPISFVISAVFITAAVGSVHLLNVGLRRGTALFVVPFYYVSSTSLAIVGGLVYFEEFARFTALQMVVFFGGVGLTVLGVWISTRGQMEEEEREAEEEEAEEEREVEEELEAQLKQEEHKSAATLTPPSRSSPSTQSPRSSTAASPRGFTPRQPSIQEEEAEAEASVAASSDEEERESAKRRAWHQKRAVSEPRLSFILPSPSRSEPSADGRYGSFTTAASSSSASSASASSDAAGALPTIQSPPLLGISGGPSRVGRTQSMSMAEPVNLALHSHHLHHHAHQGRGPASARRAYTPHYTLAFYPLLPSNPQVKRKSRAASAAASRQMSPQSTPTRRLRL